MIAVIRRNGSIVEGEVFDDPRTKIVCRCDNLGNWEPLYAMIRDERKPLPHCFKLNGASVDALDAALRKQ